ncbi:hypothetical protein CDAR_21491 [Caerostris darwini]|uniref:Uncharacterized protein n=1 Tax=Caerostris darwini TaxID=1538125 RepID=A0AAV4VYH7_9ARAC|nr:hypothetical protein CDAR_21491 [Caerostris darwini]
MYLNFVILFVAIGIVDVNGGCVEEPAKKDAKKDVYLKDVELIGDDLKFDLDHKVGDKELLEKTLSAIKAYFLQEKDNADKDIHYSLDKFGYPVEDLPSSEKHEMDLKMLKEILSSQLKTENVPEEDLKAMALVLKHFFEEGKEKLFLEKEDPEKFFKMKEESKPFLAKNAKLSTFSPEDQKDLKKYLEESALHLDMDKDAKYLHGVEGVEALSKELEKSGVHHDSSIPYFLMDEDAKAYFEGAVEGAKHSSSEIHSVAGDEDKAYKKALNLMKDSVYHEEVPYLHHSADISKELDLEKASESGKALEHKTLHKEKIVNNGKDHIYDEILKTEEFHPIDDDEYVDEKLHKAVKGFEEYYPKEGVHISGEIGLEKSHGIDKELRELKSLEEAYAKELSAKSLNSKTVGLEKSVGSEKSLRESKALEGAYAKDLSEKDLVSKSIGFEKSLGNEKVLRETKALEETYAKDLSTKGLAAKTVGIKGEMKKDEEIVKSKKDLSIEEILKEDGYYINGGTPAYEAARDQAHVDAKIPLIEGKEKSVGVKTVLAEDDLKIFKTHEAGAEFGKGKDTFLHGIKGTEGILKEEKKVHEIGVGYDEEHFKHAIKTDESHLMHGIHSGDEKHHFATADKIDETVAKEGSHSKLHEVKHKILGFLGRMLHMKKCYLVNMPPRELLGIIDCISRSKNPLLCQKFSMCEKKMPLQAILALEKCQKETIHGEAKRCTKYEPLYPSRDIPIKLTPPEKKMMMDFEECARLVKAESCGRIRWG